MQAIKKSLIYLFLGLTTVTNAFAVNWKSYNKEDFYDTDSVKRNGAVIAVTTLFNYPPQSYTYRWEFNCSKNEVKHISTSVYSKVMADELTEEKPMANTWLPIKNERISNSTRELYSNLCKVSLKNVSGGGEDSNLPVNELNCRKVTSVFQMFTEQAARTIQVAPDSMSLQGAVWGNFPSSVGPAACSVKFYTPKGTILCNIDGIIKRDGKMVGTGSGTFCIK